MQQLPPAGQGYAPQGQFPTEQPIEQYPTDLTLEQPPATSPGDALSTDIAPETPYDNLQTINEVEQGQEQPVQESEPIDVPFSSVEEPEAEGPNNVSAPQPQFGKSIMDTDEEQNGN